MLIFPYCNSFSGTIVDEWKIRGRSFSLEVLITAGKRQDPAVYFIIDQQFRRSYPHRDARISGPDGQLYPVATGGDQSPAYHFFKQRVN
jgi:hypothetical protein